MDKQNINMDKQNINTLLKIAFIFSAFALFLTLSNTPKTNCDTCSFDFDGKNIDGEEAWLMIEQECISYDKPWTPFYIDIDYLNVSENEDGIKTIELTKEGKKRWMMTN